jgi:lysophospholipase L1-like esterase
LKTLFDFITRKIIIRIPVWALLLIPLAAYAAWECYWYSKVGTRVIRWHTHLALWMYVWALGLLFFKLFGKRFSGSTSNLFLVFTSIVFALGLMEVYLEMSGTYKTYPEQVSGYYDSPYTPQDLTYYHAWSPNKPHWITKPEYSHWRPTNSLGLADSEWTTLKQKGQIRLMTLGDSFTEGDGAAYDSSYVAFLQKKLRAAGDTFYMMNAGVCGSDPFMNYIFLKDRLLLYKPDVVIQVLATNDMETDIQLRGGLERFQPNGKLKYNTAPWWEPLYAISCVARVFFRIAGYNELLQKETLNSSDEKWLNEKTADLFAKYATLCKQNGIRLFVVLRPDRQEIENRNYNYDFSYISNQLRQQNVEIVDLLPSYLQYISKNKSEPRNYFWVNDGHHNARGYEMMAQAIYDNLTPILNDSVNVKDR